MIGEPAWALDPRFADLEGRKRHAAELRERIEELIASADLAEWARRLDEAELVWGARRHAPRGAGRPAGGGERDARGGPAPAGRRLPHAGRAVPHQRRANRGAGDRLPRPASTPARCWPRSGSATPRSRASRRPASSGSVRLSASQTGRARRLLMAMQPLRRIEAFYPPEQLVTATQGRRLGGWALDLIVILASFGRRLADLVPDRRPAGADAGQADARHVHHARGRQPRRRLVHDPARDRRQDAVLDRDLRDQRGHEMASAACSGSPGRVCGARGTASVSASGTRSPTPTSLTRPRATARRPRRSCACRARSRPRCPAAPRPRRRRRPA